MAHSWTLPTIGVLALGAAALGVHLGNEAISEINPIYFQEPPTRFHSDLSPYQSPTAGTYSARMDMGSPLELGTGCIGCRTYPEEYYPDRDEMVIRAVEGTPEQPSVELAVAEAPAEADMIQRQADLDRLQRYAAFAVQREEPRQDSVDAVSSGEASAIQGDELASAE